MLLGRESSPGHGTHKVFNRMIDRVVESPKLKVRVVVTGTRVAPTVSVSVSLYPVKCRKSYTHIYVHSAF